MPPVRSEDLGCESSSGKIADGDWGFALQIPGRCEHLPYKKRGLCSRKRHPPPHTAYHKIMEM